jgi:hypothetical protein
MVHVAVRPPWNRFEKPRIVMAEEPAGGVVRSPDHAF